jgi:uncharacterized RDD family membrane protein YckC
MRMSRVPIEQGSVTSEAVALDLDLAGLGSRLVAALMDGVIQAAGMVVIIMAGALLLQNLNVGEGAPIALAILYLGVFFGYPGLFEGLWEGRTPGKRIAGIRVVQDNGLPVTWRHVAIRTIFRLLDMPVVGALAILLTKRSQRLGDLAAGTIVVHEHKTPAPQTLDLAPDGPRDALAGSLDTTAVSDGDYVLLRSFLTRRSSLRSGARAELAARLAATLRQRSGMPHTDLSDEQLLEAVIVSIRGSSERTQPSSSG